MTSQTTLDRYALLALECGFTPRQVDEMSLQEVQAIIELIARRNQAREEAWDVR